MLKAFEAAGPAAADLPPRYKLAKLGPLPEEWELVSLGSAVTLQRGHDLPISDRRSGPYPVVGSNGVVGFHAQCITTGPGVLVGRSGSAGRVTWVASDYWPLNTSLWVKDFHGNDPEFAYYLLLHLDLGKYAAGVSVPTLNRNTVHPIKLGLPPLTEQRAIAHVLRTVQRAKEATEAIIAATRELKKSMMRHLFTYGPVPVDQVDRVALKETVIGPVPEGWGIVGLGKLARVERGKFAFRPRNDPRFYGGAVPFVQTGDVTRAKRYIRSYTQSLNDEGVSVSLVFPKGTIVLTIAANIGYSAILAFDSAFPDSLVGITPIGDIDTEFLQYYLETQQPKMDRLAPRGTQKNINIQFLSPWPAPVVSIDEQKRIVIALSAADRKLQAMDQRMAALDALFRTLLSELMTGRMRAETATAGLS